MATLIENQTIAKRCKTSRSGRGNGSASYNSDFINIFNQKPSGQKKRKTAKPSIINKSKKKTIIKKPGSPSGKNAGKTGVMGSGFSIRIPFTSLLLITAVIVAGFAALNWEDININTLKIYSFPLTEEMDAAQRTRRYAATGDTGFPPPVIEFDVLNNPIKAAEGEIDHYGALITFEWKEHKVQKNETLSHIARKYNISYGTIVAVNNIKNARKDCREGMTLRVPTVDGLWYEVRKGDTLSKISLMQNIPLNAILDVNDIKTDHISEGEKIFLPGAKMNDIDLRLSLGDSFMYPLHGKYITSRFGTRKDPKTGAWQFHEGVDFRGATGTTVMASMDGNVTVVGENRLYGKYIIITHGNGYKTLYGHLNSVSVKEGNNVIRGKKIGEVGETGYATGPHLHFGIYNSKGRAVNPLELLN